MIKYTITQSDNWDTYKTYMKEVLGHDNVEPRYSLDNSLVVVKLDDENLPEGFSDALYTAEEIREVLDSADWTDTPSENNEIEI